jgi:hypothetical protein
MIGDILGSLFSFRAVMDEDRGCGNCHVEVVVVVPGDGEVPHPAVMDDGDRSADHHGRLAVRRLEMSA